MDAGQRPPGREPTPSPGLERLIWRRLPALALAGSLVPLLWLLGAWVLTPHPPSAVQARELEQQFYLALGVLALHLTLLLTVAIGCVIVMVMKGPRRQADPYPLPEREDQARPPLGDRRA